MLSATLQYHHHPPPTGDLRTEALLQLVSCTPLKAGTPDMEWDWIVTPYRVAVWEQHLASHPDSSFAECIYIQRSKYPQVQVSPFGVIPKSEPGQWRLIVDLSSPAGGSVNDGINKEWCSLTYMTIEDVAARVVRLGRGALMAKVELKSAYRQVPVHPDDRWLLGMECRGQLLVDTALPFGLRSAPAIFSAVAEALAHMIRQKGVVELDHYLDDFSIVGPPDSQQCAKDLETSLAMCEEAGCPVAEKTEGPATEITLLGIELDSLGLPLPSAGSCELMPRLLH